MVSEKYVSTKIETIGHDDQWRIDCYQTKETFRWTMIGVRRYFESLKC